MEVAETYSAQMKHFFPCHAFYEPESQKKVRPGIVGRLDTQGKFHPVLDLVAEGGPLAALPLPTSDNTEWGPRKSTNLEVTTTELEAEYEKHGSMNVLFERLIVHSIAIHVPSTEFVREHAYQTHSCSAALLACSREVTRIGYELDEPFLLCIYAYARDWREKWNRDVCDIFVVTKIWTAPEAWTLASQGLKTPGKFSAHAKILAGVTLGDEVAWYVEDKTNAWNHTVRSPDDPCVLGFAGFRFKYHHRGIGKASTSG